MSQSDGEGWGGGPRGGTGRAVKSFSTQVFATPVTFSGHP